MATAKATSAKKGTVKRLLHFGVLVGLVGAWALPIGAQGTGAVEYGRQSQVAAKKQEKELKKATRKRQKQMNKYSKAQRKAAKKAQKQAK